MREQHAELAQSRRVALSMVTSRHFFSRGRHSWKGPAPLLARGELAEDLLVVRRLAVIGQRRDRLGPRHRSLSLLHVYIISVAASVMIPAVSSVSCLPSGCNMSRAAWRASSCNVTRPLTVALPPEGFYDQRWLVRSCPKKVAVRGSACQYPCLLC